MVALVLIFSLDRLVVSAPAQHLYYLPIIAASTGYGAAGGVVTAMTAIVLYHLANPHVLAAHYGELDVVQMLLFVAVAVISARLVRDRRRLRRLAVTDDLTGLHNLRSFEAHLRRLLRAARRGSAFALLVLDVDSLKRLNDAHGHLAGADAVRTVGAIIARVVPAEAVPCRYGGDEFVIALPECSEARAVVIAGEVRRSVNECAPVLGGISFPARTLSVSVGIACHVGQACRGSEEVAGEQLFHAADAALYAAKAGGRNRVSVARPSRIEG